MVATSILMFATTLLSSFSIVTAAKEEEYEEAEEISDQEVEAFLTSIVFVTVITIIIYFAIFHRNRNPNTQQNNPNSNLHQEQMRRMQRQQNLLRQAELEQHFHNQNRRWNNNNNELGNNMAMLEEEEANSSIPMPSAQHKLLIDGVLPFRHGKARSWKLEAKQQTHKRDIIIATLGMVPLSRGCNVVLTIKETDLVKMGNADDRSDALASVCNALTTLSSEYNLFVILDLEKGNTDVNRVKDTLQSVPEEVLPRHRIIASTSVVGRVAFVRQLKPELVVDYDAEVQKQLTRFGFRVEIYGDGNGGFEKLCDLVG